jgi:hypothetical protein
MGIYKTVIVGKNPGDDIIKREEGRKKDDGYLVLLIVMFGTRKSQFFVLSCLLIFYSNFNLCVIRLSFTKNSMNQKPTIDILMNHMMSSK